MNAKRDWIGTYAPNNNMIRKFQDGGAMAPPSGGAPAGTPAPTGGGQGGGDLEAMIAQYAQSRDPQLAVAICDKIVEMMAQGGAGAPGGAPAPGDQGAAPAAKKGMKLKKGPVFKTSKC